MGHGDLVWLLPAALIVVGVTAFGAWALERLGLRQDFNRPLLVAMAGAMGLGLLALATFGLSVAGFIPRWFMALLPAAGLLAGAGALSRFLRAPAAGVKPEGGEPLLPFLAGSTGLLVVAILAGSTIPPLDYDELHYHLVQPKETFLAGRYVDLEWNVYTKFPQNVESLYLYGMIVTRSTLDGVVVGRALSCAFVAFLAMGLYGLVAPLATRTLGALAAALPLVMPGTASLVLLTYVEPAQACLSFLALAASRHALVAGVFAGLAAGTKYPAIVLCVLPLACVYLRKPKSLALYACGALLAFAPWGVRGIIEHRNPVFPLGGFGTNWSGAQAEKFAEAHRGKSNAAQTFDELYDGMSRQMLLSPILAFLPLLGFAAWRGATPEARRVIALAGGLSLVYLLIWIFATHRISRFLFPVQPWLAAAGIVPLAAMKIPIRRVAEIAGAAVIVFELVLVVAIGYARVTQRAQFKDAEFREEIAADLEAEFEVNKVAGKVLLVGEARTFYLEVPYEAASVFNVKSWDFEPASLRARGITHVLVNWRQVKRLDRDYAYDFEGVRHSGLEEPITYERFDSLTPYKRVNGVEIYEVPLR